MADYAGARRGETAPHSPHDLDIPDFLRRTPKPVQAELDLARIDRADPEIVDGTLQTRLPLTDDEMDMYEALRAIEPGESSEVDRGMLRHLIGAGFAHAGTKRVSVTDEGHAFLAQLVSPASSGFEVRP